MARLDAERWRVHEAADLLSAEVQVDAFRHRAARLISRVGLDVRDRMAKGADFKSSFDANAVTTVEATKAHWCVVTTTGATQSGAPCRR